jgi:predicted dehydrogenase
MAIDRISRRNFVGDLAVASMAFTIVPRHVLGGPRHRAPSDTLNMACIGVGGRGRSDLRGVSSENIYALCDVDSRNLDSAGGSFPQAKRYADFREMLERDGDSIDAVTVATPDHTHAVAAMMAMKMGKHVYCEKPLARTLYEVKQLADGAQRYGVATQMGNQGHANEGTRQIREWVEAGAIGTVREIQYWTNRPIWPQAIERPLESYHIPTYLDWDLWLGPAPMRPYHPAYAPFRWRGWWGYGTGALGDIACHSMDAAYWALDLKYPTRIEAESTTLFEETAPAAARIEYDFPARGNRPAIKVVWRDGNLSPSRPEEISDEAPWPIESSGQMWVGDDGKLFAGIYGENPRLLDAARDKELKANPPAEKYPRTEGVYAEFVAACQGGQPAGSNFADHSGPLTEMVLLGNLAVRTGRTLDVDPENGRVKNATIPEEYLRPTYREGWGL